MTRSILAPTPLMPDPVWPDTLGILGQRRFDACVRVLRQIAHAVTTRGWSHLPVDEPGQIWRVDDNHSANVALLRAGYLEIYGRHRDRVMLTERGKLYLSQIDALP